MSAPSPWFKYGRAEFFCDLQQTIATFGKVAPHQALHYLYVVACREPYVHTTKLGPVPLSSGEYLHSVRKLEKVFSWDKSTVSRTLKRWETEGIISRRKEQAGTIITLIHYENFASNGVKTCNTKCNTQSKKTATPINANDATPKKNNTATLKKALTRFTRQPYKPYSFQVQHQNKPPLQHQRIEPPQHQNKKDATLSATRYRSDNIKKEEVPLSKPWKRGEDATPEYMAGVNYLENVDRSIRSKKTLEESTICGFKFGSPIPDPIAQDLYTYGMPEESRRLFCREFQNALLSGDWYTRAEEMASSIKAHIEKWSTRYSATENATDMVSNLSVPDLLLQLLRGGLPGISPAETDELWSRTRPEGDNWNTAKIDPGHRIPGQMPLPLKLWYKADHIQAQLLILIGNADRSTQDQIQQGHQAIEFLTRQADSYKKTFYCEVAE